MQYVTDMNPQIVQYIQYCLSQGIHQTTIRAQLLQSGWPQSQIDQALAQFNGPATPHTVSKPNRVRNGILWILSPFILLIGVALLQIVARFLLGSGSSSGIGTLINIVSLIAGIFAMPLLIVGPILGIITLTKK